MAQHERRAAAARSNYSSGGNLEKRQALNHYIVRRHGASLPEVIKSLAAYSRVIDVGCGNVLWLKQLDPAATAVGLDVSEGMVTEARAVSGRPVVRADAAALPLGDDVADVALMLWMLYHVPDKRAALREVRRVLRPRGRLLAATNAPAEEGVHADMIHTAISSVVGHEVQRWLEPLDFNTDNGEEILSGAFERCSVHSWEVEFELTEPKPLIDYLDSGRAPIEAEVGTHLPWADVLAAMGRLAEAHLRDHGVIRFTRRGAAFVASTAFSD